MIQFFAQFKWFHLSTVFIIILSQKHNYWHTWRTLKRPKVICENLFEFKALTGRVRKYQIPVSDSDGENSLLTQKRRMLVDPHKEENNNLFGRVAWKMLSTKCSAWSLPRVSETTTGIMWCSYKTRFKLLATSSTVVAKQRAACEEKRLIGTVKYNEAPLMCLWLL